MFDSAPLQRGAPIRAIVVSFALGAAGVIGLAPGIAGPFDPLTLLAWLVLIAPACGILAGGVGLRLWPAGLIPPALWGCCLVQAELVSQRHLPTPSWGLAVVSGFFWVGLGLGLRFPKRSVALAGAVLLGFLLLSGVGVLGVLGPAEGGFARTYPYVAGPLLECSPLVLAYECAGVDYTHMQPDVYGRSSVEWIPRRPYNGALAGSVVLLVGSLLALWAARSVDRSEKQPHVRP